MAAAEPLPIAMVRSGWVVRVGLEAGLVGSTAAIAWADRWIVALPEPPVELAEVSMPGRAGPADLASGISAVVGDASPSDQFAITVALFDRAVAAGRCTVEVAVRQLTMAMLDTDVADDVRNELWHLDYNAELEHPLDAAALDAAFHQLAAPFVAAWGDAIDP